MEFALLAESCDNSRDVREVSGYNCLVNKFPKYFAMRKL